MEFLSNQKFYPYLGGTVIVCVILIVGWIVLNRMHNNELFGDGDLHKQLRSAKQGAKAAKSKLENALFGPKYLFNFPRTRMTT